MMRYMGWSYSDLQTCPVHYLEVIREVSEKEVQAAQQRRRK